VGFDVIDTKNPFSEARKRPVDRVLYNYMDKLRRNARLLVLCIKGGDPE
jgi:hypothetical protein